MGAVVVTGVAGALGQRVAHKLDGHAAASRLIGLDTAVPSMSPPGMTVMGCDLAAADERTLEAAMAGASAVLHLAWRTPDEPQHTRADEAEAQAINRDALGHVLAAAAAAGVQTVVYLSSATVYGAWSDNPVPLTEDAPLRPNPEFAFAVGKAEAERAAAGWAEAHPEVAVAVLRPAITLGAPSRPLYQALSGTRSPKGDDAGRLVQFLHVDDLAAAVVLAWERRLRGVYNVAPDGGIREDTARALVGGVAKVALPARAARAVAHWSWRLWRRGSPREAEAYTRWSWAVAPDRMLAAGWIPRYSSEQALVETDERAHWDDLPPGRRQNLTVLAATGGVLAAGSAVAAVLVGRSRRAARRR